MIYLTLHKHHPKITGKSPYGTPRKEQPYGLILSPPRRPRIYRAVRRLSLFRSALFSASPRAFFGPDDFISLPESLFYLYERIIPHLGRLISEQVNGSSGDIGESELALILLDRISVGGEVIVDDAGNAVERMARLSLRRTVFVQLRLAGLFIHLEHLVRVAVVGGDDSRAVELVDNRQQACELKVERLHAALGCGKVAGMAYHIAVREVARAGT